DPARAQAQRPARPGRLADGVSGSRPVPRGAPRRRPDHVANLRPGEVAIGSREEPGTLANDPTANQIKACYRFRIGLQSIRRIRNSATFNHAQSEAKSL